MKTNDELLSEYQAWQNARRLKVNTVVSAQSTIRRIIAGTGGHLLTLTGEEIAAFLAVASHNWSDRTLHSYVSCLHVFYGWAYRKGYRSDDPTVDVPLPKIRRTLPRPAEIDQIAEVLAHLDHELRLWVLMMTLNGLRCCEVSRLSWENVSANHFIRVHGKDDQWRSLPMHREVIKAFDRTVVRRDRGPVFRQPDGEEYPPAYVSRIINRTFKNLGYDITAHQLRHTFATEHTEVHGNAVLLANLLGHRDLKNTLIYAGVRSGRMRESVDALELPGVSAERETASLPRVMQWVIETADTGTSSATSS